MLFVRVKIRTRRCEAWRMWGRDSEHNHLMKPSAHSEKSFQPFQVISSAKFKHSNWPLGELKLSSSSAHRPQRAAPQRIWYFQPNKCLSHSDILKKCSFAHSFWPKRERFMGTIKNMQEHQMDELKQISPFWVFDSTHVFAQSLKNFILSFFLYH